MKRSLSPDRCRAEEGLLFRKSEHPPHRQMLLPGEEVEPCMLQLCLKSIVPTIVVVYQKKPEVLTHMHHLALVSHGQAPDRSSHIQMSLQGGRMDVRSHIRWRLYSASSCLTPGHSVRIYPHRRIYSPWQNDDAVGNEAFRNLSVRILISLVSRRLLSPPQTQQLQDARTELQLKASLITSQSSPK
jgi:hypothetical protein